MGTALDDTSPSPASAEANTDSLTAWLDALDWHCTACGYSMLNLATPICPECGTPASLDQVRSSLRFKPRPQPVEPDPVWRQLRVLGTPKCWALQLCVLVLAWIPLDHLDAQSGFTPLLGAMAGMLLHLIVMSAGWFVGSLVSDTRIARGKPPPSHEGSIARLYARLKGLLGTWSTGCLAIALLAGLIAWINS